MLFHRNSACKNAPQCYVISFSVNLYFFVLFPRVLEIQIWVEAAFFLEKNVNKSYETSIFSEF
jgi:hypothetical protein